MAKKKRKYPKSPKATASSAVWEAHVKKCQEVDKYNNDIDRDKTKVKTLIKKAQSLKKK
jgi:hypothetical protein